MSEIEERVAAPWPVDRTFAFMADLRNFERWDPGVKGVRQVTGNGPGPDAVFDVTVGGIGRDIVLRYHTLEYDPPRRVVVEATNAVMRSRDEIDIEPDGNGSVVVYHAGLSMRGLLRITEPLLGLAFPRIVRRAAEGLRRTFATETP